MSLDSTKQTRVLVTGATGFVGGRLIEAMFLSGTAVPVAGIRSWTRVARIARFPIEMVPCDILDTVRVQSVLKNVDAVVHCAYTNDRESIVRGTHNLLAAAVENNLRRFVFLSSAEVYGHAAGEVDEHQPTAATGFEYADAKIEAETLCREFAARGVRTTILRPSLIYGPFGVSWTIDIAKRLQSGSWREFDGHGEGYANLVYVDDLVHAIFRTLSSNSPSGEAFNINGPDRITWNEYFQRFNEALGRPRLQRLSQRRTRLRTALTDVARSASDMVRAQCEEKLMEIYLRGGLAGRMMKRLKGVFDSTPSGDELERLYSRQAYYCDAKARQTLGYEPAFDMDTGMRQSVSWLVHNGLAGVRPLRSPVGTAHEQRISPSAPEMDGMQSRLQTHLQAPAATTEEVSP